MIRHLNLRDKAAAQLGTVGSGNHYVDVFVDEQDRVWIGVLDETAVRAANVELVDVQELIVKDIVGAGVLEEWASHFRYERNLEAADAMRRWLHYWRLTPERWMRAMRLEWINLSC